MFVPAKSTMKVSFIFVWFSTAASVTCLSQPKFIVKSRSVVSLETAAGAKADVSLVKKESARDASTSEIAKQPRPALLSCPSENKNYDDEYWYHPQIHTLGNAGIFGAIHAALAPLSTYIIDTVAYGGVDVRLKVSTRVHFLWSQTSRLGSHYVSSSLRSRKNSDNSSIKAKHEC